MSMIVCIAVCETSEISPYIPRIQRPIEKVIETKKSGGGMGAASRALRAWYVWVEGGRGCPLQLWQPSLMPARRPFELVRS